MLTLYPEPQLKAYHFELQLKECPTSPSLGYHPNPYRPHTSNAFKHTASALLPSVVSASPSQTQLQTTWRKHHVARRHASLKPLTLQVSASGTNLTARRQAYQ